MAGGITIIALVALALVLLYAAWGDWQRRDIPNWLNGAIALGAPIYWWAAGFQLWPEVAIIVGVAIGLSILFTIAFAIGAMGGGDVKMIGALSLWMTPLQLPVMLIVMAIGGGVLTLAMLIHHKMSENLGKPEIPYGIAIAGGGLWISLNEILTIANVTR